MLVNNHLVQDEFGRTMHESRLRTGLLNLNPRLVFDFPGRMLDLTHPNIERWQNIRLPDRERNGGHIGSMDRGDIPEADVWLYDDKSRVPIKILRIGWRTTLEAIARHHIPGLEWPDFCREFQTDKTDRKAVFVEKDENARILPACDARHLRGWMPA